MRLTSSTRTPIATVGSVDDELERARPLMFEAAQQPLRVTADAPPLDSRLERYELSGGHTLRHEGAATRSRRP